jgi:serine/threonine protein kinase
MKLADRVVIGPLATYEVNKSLGEGGAGIVFAATRDDGEAVALKVLRPSSGSREKLKRFRNELYFCLRTSDPHIVPVTDFGLISTDEGAATYYVMPRMASSLREHIKGGISATEANRLLVNMLNAVEAAHLRGVWHRDLKPENFLVKTNGDLVLSDFGAAHFHTDLLLTSVETKPQHRLANFEYAAPEQRRKGDAVDSRCDIYALGLMTHELFTGHVPHGKGHELISATLPDYAYLDEIVEWMTQHAPARRPSSIDEIRLRIDALGKEAGSRRRILELENKVVSSGESDDPLIISPPRLTGIDVQDRTLHLHLSTPVTSSWVYSFQNTNYRNAMLGAAPSDFSFNGNRASLTIRYNAASRENLQQVIEDFKRFLELGAAAYKERVEKERRQSEQEAQRQRGAQLKAERERLTLLQQLRI